VSRRARATALLGLSAVCAGLAVSLVNGYARDIRAQVGPLVPVVVVTKDLPRATVITPRIARGHLAERSVPVRFVPPGSLRSANSTLGLRVLARVPSGSYLGATQLGSPGRERDPTLAAGGSARLVEVPVSGASTTADLLRPGMLVDVLITSERGPGPPRTYLALQRVELVGLRPPGDAVGEAGSARDSVAALRVTLREAVLLTAAQNFARELRLVPRPRGDYRRFPPTAIAAGDLHP
jgi:pilus assembly protein CpaB